ncbi:MAG TPA: DUF1573 domain-containing protein [Lacipirellulaceae bacterium]|nr:DUF1573 domain-containing protein [Lacipirellulaceae bacterium]
MPRRADGTPKIEIHRGDGFMQMRWLIAAIFCIAALAAQAANAEAWVAKMFEQREHDFGTVARGADTVYRFPVKNIYKQDIELVSVRSSCGCTTPSLENKVLKTYDVGYVVARFNTRTFTGLHGATLTVEVRWNDNGRVRRGETQVRVNGNIRGDVVFQPGAIQFDSVQQGTPAEERVEVTYAGRSTWKIVDVRGASDDFEVVLTQKQRYSGRVGYELLVRLKETAAAGYFNEQLVLVTNDDRNPRIPLHVAGRVISQISVAPESVLLGNVTLGGQVSKKVIVRGQKPFRILSVKCDEDSFQFKVDDRASERHVVEIVFDAKKNLGNVKQTIHIATDLGEEFRTTLTAYANVLPDKTESETKNPDAESKPEEGSTAGAASEPPGQVASQ